MIRHRISAELRARVAAEAPDWITQAARAANHYQAHGMALAKNLAFTGETKAECKARRSDATACRQPVRAILRELQHGKCAFCEQRLPAGTPGQAAFHLEHYRPVEGAKTWKTDAYTGEAIPPEWQALRGRPYHTKAKWTQGDGYPWLEFSLDNISAACDVCNRALKRSYFPARGPGPRDATPADLDAVEHPRLLRPVGDDDRLDPADYITFEGVFARPSHPEGHTDHLPGAVTIRLLGLGTAQREELIEVRCQALVYAWSKLKQREQAGDETARMEASNWVDALCAVGAPQAACVRALVASFDRDPIATAGVMADVETRYRQLIGYQAG